MWRKILSKFSASNGGLKQIAINKFMQLKLEQDKTVSQNMCRFEQIITSIAGLGVTMPSDLKITKLMDAFPSSWEPFRQAFNARTDEAQTLSHLMYAIESEATRLRKLQSQSFGQADSSGRQATTLCLA